ncbi:MAG: spore germination protein GerPE [Niallia sp.]
MLQRTSVVDLINVNTVSFSSIVEIGDATYHQAVSRALAVQRQRELFYGSEGAYEDYDVFREPIPLIPIIENVACHFENIKPIIKVHHINITGISSSSLLQIGNCRHIYRGKN